MCVLIPSSLTQISSLNTALPPPSAIRLVALPKTSKCNKGSNLNIQTLRLLIRSVTRLPSCPLINLLTAAASSPSDSLTWLTDTLRRRYHTEAIFQIIFTIFLSRAEVIVDGGGLWKSRAGREGKAPQMKILNQYALPLQLRPRQGLHLIYSPKPGNQAIKRNQTIRFPALNGPTAWCGQPGIRLNPFEVAGEHQRQQLPRPDEFISWHSGAAGTEAL